MVDMGDMFGWQTMSPEPYILRLFGYQSFSFNKSKIEKDLENLKTVDEQKRVVFVLNW